MYTMTDIQAIREAYYRKGYTISTIANNTGIDRKTVRKFIMRDNWNMPQNEQASHESILDPFTPIIDAWLADDLTHRAKQRHTAKRVYQRLVEEQGKEGFPCSYRTVAAYVAEVKKARAASNSGFLPLDHPKGEAQGDFGEADFYEHDALMHGSYFVLAFPHSNAGFLQLYKGQDFECLAQGFMDIFNHIGKVAHTVRLDNASTMVQKILKHGERSVTERFRRLCEHYGSTPVFCNAAKGNEKGSVENKVGYLRRNLLVPVPHIESLKDYNATLLTQCDEDHARNHFRLDRPIAELFQEDLKAMHALPEIVFDAARYETVRTDAYACFTLDQGRHRYSTAPKYAGSLLSVRCDAFDVIVFNDSGREIVRHERLRGEAKQERIDWLPYLSQLSHRPAALKYTPVYEMLPNDMREWLSEQPRDAVGKALGLIAALTVRSGFDSACQAVTSSLRCGVTDADSLLALHDRLFDYGEFTPPLANAPSIDAPRVLFTPSRYDEMLPLETL